MNKSVYIGILTGECFAKLSFVLKPSSTSKSSFYDYGHFEKTSKISEEIFSLQCLQLMFGVVFFVTADYLF